MGQGIGCIDGALITPRGVYNVAQVLISEEFPQGQVVVPIRELSDTPVKIGQHLKEILSSGIIESNNFFLQKDHETTWIVVHRKGASYFIQPDKNGFITRVGILTSEEKKKLSPKTDDPQELEDIYRESKKLSLAEAKIMLENHPAHQEYQRQYFDQVYEAVKKDPSHIHFESRSQSRGGRIQILWTGRVTLPGVPGEFEVHLSCKNLEPRLNENDEQDKTKSEFLFSNNTLADKELTELERSKNEEKKKALVEYLHNNIVQMIKKGKIESFNDKPFDYQKLIENIAKMDFSFLHYSSFGGSEYMRGEFPESLYEGQPVECRLNDENNKDRIGIEIQKDQKVHIKFEYY